MRARFCERVIRKNPPLLCLSQMNFVDVVKVQKCLNQSVPIGENCLLERRLPQGRFKAELAPSRFTRARGGRRKGILRGREIVAGMLSIAQLDQRVALIIIHR